MTEQIVVAGQLPAAPFVLVDGAFMASLAETEVKVKALAVTDAASAQAAASLLNELTKAGTALEKARIELKNPFITIERRIDASAKIPAARIEDSKRILKIGIANWHDVEAHRIRKAEQERQAELARLEKIRLAEEAEIARKAAELAAQAAPVSNDLDFDFAEPVHEKTETEKKIEAVKYAPAVKAEKPTGVRSKVVLQFTVSDTALLPDQFVIRTANEREIRETYCKGWKEGDPIPSVPGVKFETQREISSTGKETPLF